jgi:nitrile hydratase
MDGIHDLGGMQGFGPIVVEPNEPVFHEPWEPRARALVYAAGQQSTGEFRHAIERMDPLHYLASSYYEHWLTAAATIAVERGRVTHAELEEEADGLFPLARPVAAAALADAVTLVSGGGGEPRFSPGDRVRVTHRHSPGHTRCPRYVRGQIGTVVRVDGVESLPDVEAHLVDRRHEPTYSVGFEASDLWGDAQAGVVIHVDLWESYLEGCDG